MSTAGQDPHEAGALLFAGYEKVPICCEQQDALLHEGELLLHNIIALLQQL